MKNYFKDGTFLFFPLSYFLLSVAFHEDDGLWTPIFIIGGIFSLIAGFAGITDSIFRKKEKTKRDFRESFIKTAEKLDTDKYQYKQRENPLPIEFRKEVISKTGGYCFYCAKNLIENNIWEMDHFYPHRRGGIDSVINLVPTCAQCNERKWSKNPVDFILELWTCDENITKFLRGFLIQHRDKSLSYLTSEPYEKGICDYWYATKQKELFELIITNSNLKMLNNKKDVILKQAQILVWELFNRYSGFGDYDKKYDLLNRIENYKFMKDSDEKFSKARWERFLSDNPESNQ